MPLDTPRHAPPLPPPPRAPGSSIAVKFQASPPDLLTFLCILCIRFVSDSKKNKRKKGQLVLLRRKCCLLAPQISSGGRRFQGSLPLSGWQTPPSSFFFFISTKQSIPELVSVTKQGYLKEKRLCMCVYVYIYICVCAYLVTALLQPRQLIYGLDICSIYVRVQVEVQLLQG